MREIDVKGNKSNAITFSDKKLLSKISRKNCRNVRKTVGFIYQ